LSIFIYLDYFSLHVKILDTIFAVLGFYSLLTCNKKIFTWVGFFIGIFWFYWISFSFRYYELIYLIPLVIVGFGLIYSLFFYLIGLISKTPEIRTVFIFLLMFFEPFGFNWFKPELILINSYFSTNIYLFGLFLISINLLVRLKQYWKIFPVIFLILLSFFNNPQKFEKPSLDIAIANLNLDQNKKWKQKYKQEIINGNFFIINEAIKKGKELVILPESAFPMYLNLEENIIEKLKELSLKITIFTGGLSVRDDKVFNSSFLFQNGDYQIANKVVLVPFGEKIPLPKWAVSLINDWFFNGADDYESAKEPFDFNISGYSFRNAICYEATTNQIYKNNPKYMIAISNNAWFQPSIEPTLQKLLLKLHAKKYNTIIYHSANSGISGIITP